MNLKEPLSLSTLGGRDFPDRAGQLSDRMKIQIEPDGQWQSGSIWTVVLVFFYSAGWIKFLTIIPLQGLTIGTGDKSGNCFRFSNIK